MTFYYKDLSTGEDDLKLFSGMNANEGKTLLLVHSAAGYEITTELPVNVNRIHAISIDGKLFVPK